MVGQVNWAWGYANSHPPLYSWLVRLTYEATHNWVAATSGPKYALMAAGYLLVWDAVRRASGSRVTAALSSVALLLIPVVVWKTQGKLSHSVIGFAATAATVHAAGLVLSRGRWRDFAWLGVAVSAGVLSKYNYLLVLAGLLVAVAALPEGRRAILRPKTLLVVALAVLLTGPHLWWLKSHFGDATDRLYMLKEPQDALPQVGVVPIDGLLSLLIALAISVGPPLLAWLVAARVLRPDREPADIAPRAYGDALRRLALVMFAASIAGFALGALFGGFHKVHERYLLALVPAFAVWLPLAWRLEGRPRAAGALLALGALVAIGVTVARPVLAHSTDTRLAWPYAQFAAQLLPLTPQNVAVVAQRPENSANLAINLPGAAVFDGDSRPAAVLAAADDAAGVGRIEQGLAGDYAGGPRVILCGRLMNRLRKRACLATEVLVRKAAAAQSIGTKGG